MMRIGAWRARLQRFRKANGGAAAVEFALIVPILLLLYFGSVETSQLIIADRRVNTVSGTLGDLVARSKDSISQSTLDNYFSAASSTMGPLPIARLAQVVSLLRVDASGAAKVVWSRAYPSSVTPRAVNSVYDMSSSPQMRSLAQGKDLVISEASYSYSPMLTLVFRDDITLSHTNFYLPRFEGTITCC